MTTAINNAFRKAIIDGIFPSASILVGRKDEIIFKSYYGDARENTCFDVASLTKPVSTATIAMMLVAEGLLKYDDTVYQWLAGARRPVHKKMTARHLLNHTSGLPAWQPYYRELPLSLIGTEAGKRMILEGCYDEPLVAEPGEKTIYSDIGYMILGAILEEAGSGPIDSLFSQYVARPLALPNSFYVRTVGAPLLPDSHKSKTTSQKHVHSPRSYERNSKSEEERRRFAPTEDCPWRERVIHGEVHDQNTYALGGVGGQSGLFSTVEDIHRFTTELIRCYDGESKWLPQDVVRQFLEEGKEKPDGLEYVLGWNRPSKQNSAAGRHFSANSIGHLGYTGCSLWIDLSQNFHIILLTNRIHPSTLNEKIKAFRPYIHDFIYDEMIGK